jgi:hypothetical protein
MFTTVTKTFNTREEFNVWFDTVFRNELISHGIKSAFLQTSESNHPFWGKEMYYFCEIPSLKTRFHFHIRRQRPSSTVKQMMANHFNDLVKRIMARR